MKISKEAKIDAYSMAISYLKNEECSYDNDGDFKQGRQWLADKLYKDLVKLKAGC